jgi:hypothetical protein
MSHAVSIALTAEASTETTVPRGSAARALEPTYEVLRGRLS